MNANPFAYLWKFWKTRGFGFILVLLGAVQGYSEQLRLLVQPKTFGWLVIGIGVTVAGLGFLNVQQGPPPPPESDSGPKDEPA